MREALRSLLSWSGARASTRLASERVDTPEPTGEPIDDGLGATRLGLAVGLLLLGAGLCIYALVPERPAHAAAKVEVSLAGEALGLSASTDARERALTAARAFLRHPVKLNAGPWELTTTYAALGARVDLEKLEGFIRDGAREGVLREHFAKAHGSGTLALPIPARFEGHRAEAWLLGVRDQIYQRVRDARVDLRKGQITPEQAGLSLDVHGTLDRLEDALFHGVHSVEARLIRTPAKRLATALAGLDLTRVIGSFETRYNTQDADRSYNLRTAARHVDGIVLMPGEIFDFNAVVGERSEANGFRPAPVIAGGELADGVGGGTCQIAGTLYAAAYFAGLPFIERSTHTRPSAYLRLGLDATVAYPKLNLKLQNDLPTPIALGVEVGGGRVRVEVRGAQTTQREVTFVRRLDEVLPYTEASREDPTLPSGVRVLAQRGVAGFRITSFRIVHELSTHAYRRERSQGFYPPTTQIWRVGSGGPVPENYVPPPPDPHTEYRTDEYLILTQGPGRQGTEETVKREGRTGYAGWTAAEGMPQAE